MAITTLDGALAGMQPPASFVKAATPTLATGRPHSLFYLAGMPGAAAAPTPGLAGAALSAYAGQLPFSNPPAGQNSHLARLQALSNTPGTLILADRIWHNSGLNLKATTAQTINSVPWGARDALGSASGEQVFIGLEVTAATGTGTPSFTLGYTNQDGVGGRSGAGVLAGAASSPVGAFYPLGLQAGDRGVRSVQSFTLSASWVSGAASLVAYREIARLELPAITAGAQAIDALTSGFPRLFNDSVPFLIFVPGATTATNISGQMVLTKG